MAGLGWPGPPVEKYPPKTFNFAERAFSVC